MKNRSEFAKYLLDNNLTKIGVEIGSFKAEFAREILNQWTGKLYLIDVWRSLSNEEYDDASNHKNHEDIYSQAMKNIESFEDRAYMLRMKSEQAVELFDDYSLDFVYIDANHTYESVKDDINLWYPKVKINGIIAGHDFLDLPDYNKENYNKGIKNLPIYMTIDGGHQFYAGMFGVNPAVEEFCEEHNYKFNVTQEWMGTWWFTKK